MTTQNWSLVAKKVDLLLNIAKNAKSRCMLSEGVRMVVPESDAVVQPAESGDVGVPGESSQPGFQAEQDSAGAELEEVRKLQELVRRLEVQNQTLRSRGGKGLLGGANGNGNDRTLGEEEADEAHRPEDNAGLSDRDFSPCRPQDSSSSGDASPLLEVGPPCGRYLDLPCANGPEEPPGLAPAGPASELQDGPGPGRDHSALDEVDVLDLEDCDEAEDEDSWLYVSPKKQALAEQRQESPMKWCRKVLDHPSPETEVACRTLISRLDQTTRWRNLYSSPSQGSVGASSEAGSSSTALLSPGYHKSTNKTVLTCGSSGHANAPSALSSQSSIDSELSTSDDSISMGYKLQDLTDVQIMARLQEESLRQDYASSSASVSRRSSSASLQSLRRGTYSDQEFDTYSLEDEDDDCCSLPQRLHRYSPSPLSSPRCQSPSALAEYGRLSAQRARPPRRSLQGPGPELLKFAKSEELRHSMPNLAPRTSLRSLEAVRNSRSMEANLQSPGNRISRLPHSSTGTSSSRIRGNGQSPLSLRAPVKAMGPMGPMAGVRQPLRGAAAAAAQGGSAGAVRRVQSPGPAGRAAAGSGKQTPGRARVSLGGPGPAQRGRLAQPARRSMGWTKSCSPVTDESWKDGCY
ncbi:SLAIN motif-containing protein-like isoform X2 [Conger conger]|uniref:SLAIN motif-containing protein-like isoform X2 n=1 Tax=Conger conger TaxID=82655 RepID=UPI002A5A4EEA|nr:SLAIN motif-containing protein-like isoform X2 [Conger conger]